MNQKEIYRKLQDVWMDLVDLRVGDIMIVKRIPSNYQCGWDNFSVPIMARMINKEFKVNDISMHEGIGLLFEGETVYFPFFSLEKVETFTIMIDGKEKEVGKGVYDKIKLLMS